MKKVFLGFLTLFLLLAVGFASASDLDITDEVNTTASADPAASIAGYFKVNNTNTTTTLTGIDLTSTTFVGPVVILASAITFSPDPISAILPSTGTIVSFTFAVPSYQLPGTYIGTVTAADGIGNDATTPASFTVNPVPKVEVTDYSTSTPLKIISEDNKVASKTFTIKNAGNVNLPLTDASFTHDLDLSDADDDLITLSFSSIPATLTPGSSDEITVTADIDNNVDVDMYSGTVTLTSVAATANFTLEISVQPEVCKDGPIGDLDITIDDPDDGDEYAPGDTIELDVSVENNDNDEMDVGVTAFLYNIDEDDNIVEEESKVIEIGDGDEESFSLSLKLPLSGDLSEDDSYRLFVKAYEDGDEDVNCAEEFVEIEIKKEKHDTRIKDFALSPSTVSCGDSVEALIDVLNIGSSDEDDVYVELRNVDLGVNMKSDVFDLDGDGGDDEEASETFSFAVPKDTEDKDYDIEAVVYYDDGDKKASKFAKLTVEKCKPATIVTPASATVEILATGIESKDGTFSIPVKVTNNEEDQKSYTIDVTNTEGWAESVTPKALTLNKGQSSTIYFYVKTSATAVGKQSATVNVKDTATGITAAAETITLDLGGTTDVEEPSAFSRVKSSLSTSNTAFWIILDIVLVVLAVLVIKALFAKKN